MVFGKPSYMVLFSWKKSHVRWSVPDQRTWFFFLICQNFDGCVPDLGIGHTSVNFWLFVFTRCRLVVSTSLHRVVLGEFYIHQMTQGKLVETLRVATTFTWFLRSQKWGPVWIFENWKFLIFFFVGKLLRRITFWNFYFFENFLKFSVADKRTAALFRAFSKGANGHVPII